MQFLELIDISVIVALINLVNTIVNVYWSIQLKKTQATGEMLKMLTEQNKAKDEVIATIKLSKDSYKHQYMNLVMEKKKIEGQLDECRKISNYKNL